MKRALIYAFMILCGLLTWVLGWVFNRYLGDVWWMTICCITGSLIICAVLIEISEKEDV